MTRRRLFAVVAGLTLLGLVLLTVAAAVMATHTDFGRDLIRRHVILPRIAKAVHGRVYLGTISGGLFWDIRIDSVEIRDLQDSLVVATGPISVQYDPRDIMDGRILLRRLVVQRPVVRITRSQSNVWNIDGLFAARARTLIGPQRAFGDFVVIDSADIQGLNLTVREPWSPADSLRGAARDSAITRNLQRTDAQIRRAHGGFERTRRWADVDLAFSRIRWSDPDSAGHLLQVSAIRETAFDPPIHLREGHGTVRILGDSLWLALPAFKLPASVGSATGKIVWGGGLPVRYDLRVVGDSVAVADVAWVYPTMPKTGSGSMKMHMISQRDPHAVDYVITDMDMRSTASHLRGAVTFGVGKPTLEVRDVNLEGAPLDFALLETFRGSPFPVPWAGQFTGTLRGPGGPVTHFLVDEMRATFADAHVPGAVTALTGTGELDISNPAVTAFHGFGVASDSIDLRTIEFLYPGFPRLGGTISGTARLDSVWLDVRFRDADIVHRDGPTAPNHFTGDGRITYGEQFLTYDVNLLADQLSFETLARSYPTMPLRGTATGPMRLKGTVEALEVSTALAGDAGRLSFDGLVDVYPPGFAARGRGSVTDLDLARLLVPRTNVKPTRLTALFQSDMAGDSLPNLTGMLAADLQRSQIDNVRIFPSSQVRLSFGNGRMRIDTVALQTSAATLFASGALGTTAAVRDSVRYRLVVDSLGGLRNYLSDALVVRRTPADSLAGTIELAGWLTGWTGGLGTTGVATGSELAVRDARARVLHGTYAFDGFPGATRGHLSLDADTVLVSGMRLDTIHASMTMLDSLSGRYSVFARSSSGPSATAAGGVAYLPVRGAAGPGANVTATAGAPYTVTVDTLSIATPDNTWRLRAPALVTVAGTEMGLDSLVLWNTAGGRFLVRGHLSETGPIQGLVQVDSAGLAGFGALAQAKTVLGGWMTARLSVTGTRDAPRLDASGRLSSGQFGSVRLGDLSGTAQYADRSLAADIAMVRAGVPLLRANTHLPLDLAFRTRSSRTLDAPLRGSIDATNVDLGVITALFPQIGQATGKFTTHVALGGSMKKPNVTGIVRVDSGSMKIPSAGIELQRITADVALAGDSVHVRQLSASSGPEKGNIASLTGTVLLRDFSDPFVQLNVTARDFHLYNRPRVADLYLSSSGVTLSGRANASVLSGAVTVTKGKLFVPELAQKRLIQVPQDTVAARPQMLRALDSLDIRGLRVTLGDEVSLRSTDNSINIPLTGSVNVTTVRVANSVDRFDATSFGTRTDSVSRFALDGELTANRGTYTVPIGPLPRKFDVSSAKVSFIGDADLNPYLDIVANYTVRQANRETGQDVGVRLTVGGQLSDPRPTLSSADPNLRLSESDLLSYLIFGSPSFELSQRSSDYLRTFSSLLVPALGSVVGDRLSGGQFDVQFEAGRADTLGGAVDLRNIVRGARVGVAKQVMPRTFLSLNTNLCALSGLLEGSARGEDLLQSLGFKVLYQIRPGFSAETSFDPASSSLICREGKSAPRGLLSTPYQFGLDLFKAWHY
jgi:translocation and assembly module TamB